VTGTKRNAGRRENDHGEHDQEFVGRRLNHHEAAGYPDDPQHAQAQAIDKSAARRPRCRGCIRLVICAGSREGHQ
jgi:hypothetical protein